MADVADAWKLHAQGFWLVVPTNQTVRKDGNAVMGAGLAFQAAQKFPDIPARYGKSLQAKSYRMAFNDHRLLLVPTKIDWRQSSSTRLVSEGAQGIAKWAIAHPTEKIVVPALGCGKGGLSWEVVKPILLKLLDLNNVSLLPPR